MSDLFLATELEEAHIECTFPGEKNRKCRSEANPSWVSISGYDVCCFNTSLPFFPFLLLFLLLFKGRQTDRAWGLYLPSCDLRLSSKEKNIAFVDFFEAFPYLQLYFTRSVTGLFHQMVLLFIIRTGFFFQQHAAISNYFGSSLFECQRLKKTTDASCWALSCKWHLTAWALQLPATL